MFRSRNYELNSTAFMQLWQKESLEYRTRVKARLEKKEALEAVKAASKAKREAKAAARETAAAAHVAHRREARGFEQMLRQSVVEERLQASGRGGVCIVPTDVLPGDEGNRMRLMVVLAGPIHVIKMCRCLTTCSSAPGARASALKAPPAGRHAPAQHWARLPMRPGRMVACATPRSSA